MKTASEMPEAIKEKLVELLNQAIKQRDQIGDYLRLTMSVGWIKCFELMKEREQKLIEVISFAKRALDTIDDNSRLLDNFQDEAPYETSEKALAEITEKLKELGVEV